MTFPDNCHIIVTRYNIYIFKVNPDLNPFFDDEVKCMEWDANNEISNTKSHFPLEVLVNELAAKLGISVEMQ